MILSQKYSTSISTHIICRQIAVLWLFILRKQCTYCIIRGGVEDKRLKAKTKDTKKNSRPRPKTAFPRTDTLEAKDKNARGQSQGPRTQAQAFSEKKSLQKSFSRNLQFISVPRIFDWGRPKPQIT